MTNLSSCGEASDISVPAYQRGFQTLEKETSVAALNVEGRIPDWLTGTLLAWGRPGSSGDLTATATGSTAPA